MGTCWFCWGFRVERGKNKLGCQVILRKHAIHVEWCLSCVVFVLVIIRPWFRRTAWHKCSSHQWGWLAKRRAHWIILRFQARKPLFHLQHCSFLLIVFKIQYSRKLLDAISILYLLSLRSMSQRILKFPASIHFSAQHANCAKRVSNYFPSRNCQRWSFCNKRQHFNIPVINIAFDFSTFWLSSTLLTTLRWHWVFWIVPKISVTAFS